MVKGAIFKIENFRSQPLPREDQIMATWKGPSNQPLVSVLCHTFNHHLYLEDALRGFLIQRTTFPFEIILHDDASTDGTDNIIRSYVKDYPKIIKPVLQLENQYSKGTKPSLLSFPYAKGQYLALCEGDDFWINPKKLQKQIDLAKKNSNILLFFHSAISYKDDEPQKIINDYGKKSKIFSTSIPIRCGGGAMPTASLMIHRSIFENLPKWFDKAPVGDYYLQAMASINGAYYFPEPHSLYRRQTSHSVSKRNRERRGEELKNYYITEITALECLNEFFKKRYSNDINYFKSKFAQNCAVQCLNFQDYSGFSYYIKLSWLFNKNGSKSQVLLRSLTRTPRFAKFLLILRNRLFRN